MYIPKVIQKMANVFRTIFKTVFGIGILSIIFIILLLLLFQNSAYSKEMSASFYVTKVVDGDTIWVSGKGGVKQKVRLLCIDTPESVHPKEHKNTPLGIEASNIAKEKLLHKYVKLEFDTNFYRDKYGRWLAFVWYDGICYNQYMISIGMTPYVTKYGISNKYDQGFRGAEQFAQNMKLGIWGTTDPRYDYLKSGFENPYITAILVGIILFIIYQIGVYINEKTKV